MKNKLTIGLILLTIAGIALVLFSYPTKTTAPTEDKKEIKTKDVDKATEYSQIMETPQKSETVVPESIETKEEPKPEEIINLSQEMYSKNYILENVTTGQVILEHDSKVRVPIASLTKIMTAHILLDKVKDLNDRVTMDPQVIEALNAEGASMAGFLPNESVSVKDVLYGVILPSGADATTLTSNYISGSEAAFAEEMNRYAEKLGMKDTHFLNASGLHQEGHYSTVDDLRILLTEALKNNDFYDVFTTFDYQGEPCPLLGAGYTMQSTVSKSDLSINNGVIVGGKTGFTNEAALCLASIAEINGQLYMFISTGASDYSPDGPPHISDARHVYNDVAEQSIYKQ